MSLEFDDDEYEGAPDIPFYCCRDHSGAVCQCGCGCEICMSGYPEEYPDDDSDFDELEEIIEDNLETFESIRDRVESELLAIGDGDVFDY